MKKWLFAASVGLAMVASVSAQAADKIAVVNVASIFQQVSTREGVGKQLENEFKSRATELQKMENSLQTRIEKLRNEAANMKPADRNKLEKDLLAERQQFAQKAQVFEQDNRRRQAEERNKILNRIKDATKAVATKGKYDVVIDANAVAYVGTSKDITAEVLKQVK
ncbi:molecular chaperone Skp [Serratia microhaemolytica]|uniref:molecular chaperone Skp n=1 Tax=Serratia microhaemolytica TaxID=2675110 RepID=UPI000FDCF8A7|nr:molecular chaperone Skp [Serratia microhaemolytica]